MAKLRTHILSALALAVSLTSCEQKKEVAPGAVLLTDQKGPSAVSAGTTGWTQIANLPIPENGPKIIGIHRYKGRIMAAYYSGYQSQQSYLTTFTQGYVDEQGIFRAPPFSFNEEGYGFASPLSEGTADRKITYDYLDGKPFSLVVTTSTQSGQRYVGISVSSKYGAGAQENTFGASNETLCPMPYTGPEGQGTPGNTVYCAYLSGNAKLIEAGQPNRSWNLPAFNIPTPTSMAAENEQLMHLVYLVGKGAAQQIYHYTKLPAVAPVLASMVPASSPDSGDRSKLISRPNQAPILVIQRVGHASFYNVTTGARLASFDQPTTGNTIYPAVQALADGTPVVGYADPEKEGKFTVKKWTGSAWEALGSAGFTTNASGGNLYYMDGKVYAVVVNQAARSLSIVANQ